MLEGMVASLHNLLRASGITREGAAEATGVSKQSVDNWCSGRSFPNLEHISRLFSLLRDGGAPVEKLASWVAGELARHGLHEDVLDAIADRPRRRFGPGRVFVLANPAYRASYDSISKGITAQLLADGVEGVIYLDTCNRRDILSSYLSSSLMSEAEGIIVAGLALENSELLRLADLGSERCPVIFVQNGPAVMPDMCGMVRVEQYKATTTVTELLLNQGFKNIAAITWDPQRGDQGTLDRIRAYSDTVRRFGLEPHLARARGGIPGGRSEVASDLPDLPEAARRVIEDIRAEAVVTLTTHAARELVKALNDRDQVLGVDLMAASIGCREWMHQITKPPMTHMAMPYFEAGARAASLLVELQGNERKGKPAPIVSIAPNEEMLHFVDGGTIGIHRSGTLRS